ncbi:hypothetical protein RCOM_1499090 [Ricinus communis]|uniref:Uncharacterized protein n=1 Tax=Ricinus communis TaxID=3988 RepID=B9R9N5_RICCO|nr:hypothetical protein RCOM_1499090 [Ricinus communis]
MALLDMLFQGSDSKSYWISVIATHVFNGGKEKKRRDGLYDTLQHFRWPENLGWDQTEQVRPFSEAGGNMWLLFLRPPDYLAEMVKSDPHKVKVKAGYWLTKRGIDESKQRRKDGEANRPAKVIQAEKLKERAA